MAENQQGGPSTPDVQEVDHGLRTDHPAASTQMPNKKHNQGKTAGGKLRLKGVPTIQKKKQTTTEEEAHENVCRAYRGRPKNACSAGGFGNKAASQRGASNNLDTWTIFKVPKKKHAGLLGSNP